MARLQLVILSYSNAEFHMARLNLRHHPQTPGLTGGKAMPGRAEGGAAKEESNSVEGREARSGLTGL